MANHVNKRKAGSRKKKPIVKNTVNEPPPKIEIQSDKSSDTKNNSNFFDGVFDLLSGLNKKDDKPIEKLIPNKDTLISKSELESIKSELKINSEDVVLLKKFNFGFFNRINLSNKTKGLDRYIEKGLLKRERLFLNGLVLIYICVFIFSVICLLKFMGHHTVFEDFLPFILLLVFNFVLFWIFFFYLGKAKKLTWRGRKVILES